MFFRADTTIATTINVHKCRARFCKMSDYLRAANRMQSPRPLFALTSQQIDWLDICAINRCPVPIARPDGTYLPPGSETLIVGVFDQMTVIPEPTTLVLLLTALPCVMLISGRRMGACRDRFIGSLNEQGRA
jgi:hypothetical protein